MTVVARAVTTPVLPKRYVLTNVGRTDPGIYYIIGMSNDRSIIWARDISTGQNLYQSTDDGATFTLVRSFSASISGAPLELPNGEVLVFLGANIIQRSSGWAASKSAATFTTVLTMPGGTSAYAAAMFRPENVGTNGVVVLNEYGAQTVGNSTTDATLHARRVWFSNDGGLTFSVLFDISTSVAAVQYGAGLHIHSTCYHEEDNRIYMTYGDNTGVGGSIGGTNFIEMGICDLTDALTATPWVFQPISTDWFGMSPIMQFTTISAQHENIVMLPDATPYGVSVIPRLGYRSLGQMRAATMMTTLSPIALIGQNLYKAQSGTERPMIATYNGPSAAGLKNRLTLSPDNGSTWQEVYVDAEVVSAGIGIGMNVYGPTLSGKLVGNTGSLAFPAGARFTATLTVAT